MIAPSPRTPARPATDDAAVASAHAACLLDRFQAITSIACEACQRHDIPELERLVLARDQVLADLATAVDRVRRYAEGTGDDTSIEVLTGQAYAFEVLEARLVECVRKLRDEVQAALTATVRGRAVTRAYHHAAQIVPAHR